MTDPNQSRRLSIDPFAAFNRGITEPDPARAALRAAGPLVEAVAPAGGPVWIVTEAELARRVMAHPDIGKDTALAPSEWDRWTAGLEPTAAEQPALTTLDGPEHAELRRAHAPLLSAKRIRQQSDRVHDIARELLSELAADGGTVDLMDGFTIRFPVMVLLDLLGIAPEHLDAATAACRLMLDPAGQGEAVAALSRIAESGLDGDGLAAELRDRVPAETTSQQLYYHLFALIFAGQLTTDASLGFLVARILAEDEHRLVIAPETVDEAVRVTLREHPPAPYSLWRFTTAEVELAGTRVPAGVPILVDIQGINTDPASTDTADLTFGAGPHFCIGAQLAQLELRAVATVLAMEFPGARLGVEYRDLRQSNFGGIQGTRLTRLPVTLAP